MPDTLFTNASLVLNGFAELQRSFNVLIKNNCIRSLSTEPIDPAGAAIIDLSGRTLMPGLIDAHAQHAHITGLSLSPKNIAYQVSEIAIASATYLRNSLMDGYTTIREAGGADYSIAHLVATGAIIGPRVFYSGKALTQTGGGADFRKVSELIDPCGHISPFSVMSVIADGVDEVRKAAREELRKGATQIKLFVSGGVVFPSKSHSTLYEFSETELLAIVEEANARGTYVMAHVYTDEGVRRCLKAGVRSIEHANFASEEAVARSRNAAPSLTRHSYRLSNASKALMKRIFRIRLSKMSSKRSKGASKSTNGPSNIRFRLRLAPICGAPKRKNRSSGNLKCGLSSIQLPM